MSVTHSRGIQIQRGDGAGSEVFTTIGRVTSFSGPSGSPSVIDTSSFDSAAREKIVGLIDEGQVSFNVNFDSANTAQMGLVEDRSDGRLVNFKIILPDADDTTLSFSAYVMTFAPDASVDGIVTASCSLEVSGLVVWS